MPTVVQINYEVDDDLHHRVRMAAARERVTIKAFVIEALNAAVERSEAEGATEAKGTKRDR